MTAYSGPGVYHGIPEAAYHADVVPGGSLSASGAKQILRSPAHYRHSLTNRVVKDVFDIGSAVHLQALGTGWPVDVHDFDSWRTKAAQEARDESRANGRIPVLVKDYEPVVGMASALLLHPVARTLFEQTGDAEVSVFAPDTETGTCLRGRIDWLTATSIVDVKTARSAEPERFARSAADFGYDISAEWYRALIRAIKGDDLPFYFAVVESEPPYLVSVIELDAEFAQIGRARMRRAIDTYAACVASGEWPGYPEIAHLVGPPNWLAYEEGLVI